MMVVVVVVEEGLFGKRKTIIHATVPTDKRPFCLLRCDHYEPGSER